MGLLQTGFKGQDRRGFLTKIHDRSASVGHYVLAVLGGIPNSEPQRIGREILPKRGESFPWLNAKGNCHVGSERMVLRGGEGSGASLPL